MAFVFRKFVFVSFVSFVFATFVAASEAQGKKVYISVDMEGISGVVGDDQTSAGQPEYGRSRKLMAEDANAAIRGAFDGGATEVVVNDSHGSQRNLLPEDLDPRARLISHSFKRHGMVEGLDETFDAVIFVGYHAKADSPRGLFAHTGSGVVKDVQVNGRSAGEGGLNTLMAQWYGVPVVMISGDDVAVEQQKEWTPNVRGVVVKRAINMRAVEARPLAEARREIQAAAKEAVAGSRKPARERLGRLQGADAVAQLHDSGSRDGVQRNRAGGAGHGGVLARDDARGLPHHPRALPLHQSGLTEHAPRPVLALDAIDDFHLAVGQQPVGRLAFFGLGRSPLRDQRIAVARRIERPKHAGVVEPHAAIADLSPSAPVVGVPFETWTCGISLRNVSRRNCPPSSQVQVIESSTAG